MPGFILNVIKSSFKMSLKLDGGFNTCTLCRKIIPGLCKPIQIFFAEMRWRKGRNRASIPYSLFSSTVIAPWSDPLLATWQFAPTALWVNHTTLLAIVRKLRSLASKCRSKMINFYPGRKPSQRTNGFQLAVIEVTYDECQMSTKDCTRVSEVDEQAHLQWINKRRRWIA